MNLSHTVLLQFDAKLNIIDNDKKRSQGLSVAVQIGDTLWVANDETVSLERFTLTDTSGTGKYDRGKEHRQFSLDDYLRLPVSPTSDPEKTEEADLEGLAFENGYLWLIASHSLKRKKAKLEGDNKKDRKRLATVESDGNRYLLARIPIEKSDDSYSLAKTTHLNSEMRTAAQLEGGKHGNELTDALAKDEHLQPFLAIPGKDNGFDIEGLAAADGHLFIGLRGPVLRGWAIILEVVPEEDKDDATTLKLKAIGPEQRAYRKHFLQLGGLGIRDLCVQGDDLLILAGPTMDIDGPVTIFRWSDGAKPQQEAIVPADKLQRLCDIPYGQGVDHAEGMVLFTPPDGGKPDSVLIVYDSAASSRRMGDAMLADVFKLPSTMTAIRS